MSRKYHVALSFAGEDRNYVQKVANYLKSNNIQVFYDEHDQTKAWGQNLYGYFGHIFSEKAFLIILFISRFYVKKEIPRHEAESALKDPRNIVLIARFDDSNLDGDSGKNLYLDIKHLSEQKFSDMIKQKLIEKGIVFGENLSDLYRMGGSNSSQSDSIEIFIRNSEGQLMNYMEAHPILRGNNGSLFRRNSSGYFCCSENLQRDKIYSFYCVGDDVPAVHIKNVAMGDKVEVQFKNSDLILKTGSLASRGWIQMPNSNIQINPILDNNCTYFYAETKNKEGVRCNGESDRPYHFRLGEDIKLESFVEIKNIRIVDCIPNLFLIEYKKPG